MNRYQSLESASGNRASLTQLTPASLATQATNQTHHSRSRFLGMFSSLPIEDVTERNPLLVQENRTSDSDTGIVSTYQELTACLGKYEHVLKAARVEPRISASEAWGRVIEALFPDALSKL